MNVAGRPVVKSFELARPYSRRVRIDVIPYGLLQSMDGPSVGDLREEISGGGGGFLSAPAAREQQRERFVRDAATVLGLSVLGTDSDSVESAQYLTTGYLAALVQHTHTNAALRLCHEWVPLSYVVVSVRSTDDALYQWTAKIRSSTEVYTNGTVSVLSVFTAIGNIGHTPLDMMCVVVDNTTESHNTGMFLDLSPDSALWHGSDTGVYFTNAASRITPLLDSRARESAYIETTRRATAAHGMVTRFDTRDSVGSSGTTVTCGSVVNVCMSLDAELPDKTLLREATEMRHATLPAKIDTTDALWNRIGVTPLEFVLQSNGDENALNATGMLPGSLSTSDRVTRTLGNYDALVGQLTLERRATMLVYSRTTDTFELEWSENSAEFALPWANAIALAILFVLVWRRSMDPKTQNGMFEPFEVFAANAREVAKSKRKERPIHARLFLDRLYLHRHIYYVIDVMIGLTTAVAFFWNIGNGTLMGVVRPANESAQGLFYFWLACFVPALVVHAFAAHHAWVADARVSKYGWYIRAWVEWLLWKTFWGAFRASVYPSNDDIDPASLPRDTLTSQQYIRYNGYLTAGVTAILLLSWDVTTSFARPVVVGLACVLTLYCIYHAVENFYVVTIGVLLNADGTWIHAIYTAYTIANAVLAWVFVQNHLLLPYVYHIGLGNYTLQQIEYTTYLFWGVVACKMARSLQSAAMQHIGR